MTENIRIRNPVGLATQGERERRSWRFNWSRVGTPITPVFVIERETDGVDLSATLFSGLPSVDGDYAVSPLVFGVVRGVKYRLSCTVCIAGDPINECKEAYAYILGDR